MAGFGPLMVIIVSLWNKNARWKITSFDIFYGILALMALVIYVFTHNLGISIVFAIASDFFASIPTIVKSWKFPETENASVFLAGIFGNVLGLLIIKIGSLLFTLLVFILY